jgi:hypothetical protein
MTVLDPGVPLDRPGSARPLTRAELRPPRPIRVEPLLDLEWHRAIEPTGPIGSALRPAQTRRSWIHRAPETQVLSLYRSVRTVVEEVTAPWWLRALADGGLRSRIGGFAVEDGITQVLEDHPDWLYMPWTGPGEDGYWEYVPEDFGVDATVVPATLVFTDRHPGWLDLIPAHVDGPGVRLPVHGPADLRDRIAELERG